MPMHQFIIQLFLMTRMTHDTYDTFSKRPSTCISNK